MFPLCDVVNCKNTANRRIYYYPHNSNGYIFDSCKDHHTWSTETNIEDKVSTKKIVRYFPSWLSETCDNILKEEQQKQIARTQI